MVVAEQQQQQQSKKKRRHTARQLSCSKDPKATTFFIHRMIHEMRARRNAALYIAIHVRPAFALNWYTHIHCRIRTHTHARTCAMCLYYLRDAPLFLQHSFRIALPFLLIIFTYLYYILPALVSCYFVFLFRFVSFVCWNYLMHVVKTTTRTVLRVGHAKGVGSNGA